MMDFIQEYIVSGALTTLVKTLATAVITLLVANYLLNALSKALNKSDKVSKVAIRFMMPAAKFLIYFIVCIFVANSLGFNTSSIVALASVLSAAVALSAQNVLSNLFGGITLLINHPFDVNDFISVAGSDGLVDSIGFFYTVLKTVDKKTITIPNASVSSSTIINYSLEGNRRVDLAISASYDSKIDDVKNAIFKAIKKTENILDRDQFVRLSKYGSSAIDYTVRVWVESANYWQVYFDLLENIKRCFDEDGVIMTYDHIIVHNSKD